MDVLETREEYIKARRLGQKELRELRMQGKETELAVLDSILGEGFAGVTVEVGTVNVPTDRIVGTKTAGRIQHFPQDLCRYLDQKRSLHKNG